MRWYSTAIILSPLWLEATRLIDPRLSGFPVGLEAATVPDQWLTLVGLEAATDPNLWLTSVGLEAATDLDP